MGKTLTQIAKMCREEWRALAQVDDENEDGDGLPDDMTREWVDQHICLCDAAIELETRREEIEWLKEFERRVKLAAICFVSAHTADAVDEACDWLDQQRADREGPQE